MLKLATKFAPKPEALEAAYRAGFRYAELWLDAALLADWQAVAWLVRDYPLGYALHFPNRLDLAPETLTATAAMYRDLGCQCLVIHQPMFDKHHDALLQLEPTLRLAIENHHLDLQGVAAWAEQSPGLALDVEHLWKFTLGQGPLDHLLEQVGTLLARIGPKLRHVHLPGYWPGMAEHRPMYCSREMVFPVLSLLAEAGFEGLVVSEISLDDQNPLNLRMDVLLFDAWREKHEPSAESAQRK
jgi:sugar phosphate isomerase/epimerase